MQHNLVSSVTALSSLHRLRHVDVSHNAVSSLAPLAPLTCLEQLCVDSNAISTLAPLSQLTSLMEIYAAHNALSTTAALAPLDELPKLYVVDLRGNPAAARDDYFLYAVFRLRRLCVLDGEAVSAAQQAAARSKFVGRLTLEFLEERAPGTLWSSCAPLLCLFVPPLCLRRVARSAGCS
jgi:Leucine-rich repeat (LRR) protein